MKIILITILILLCKSLYSQTDFYNQFDSCKLPFYTQNLFYKYDQLKEKYNIIPREKVLKFLEDREEDLGYYWDRTNFDTGESTKVYDEYSYFYLKKINFNKVHLVLYIKYQSILGTTLVDIFLQSYDSSFSRKEKLKIHEFIADTKITRSIISRDTIKTFKYEPFENFKRVKITIYTYKVNSNGYFDLIDKEVREGNKNFTSYIAYTKNPDDDPYGK